MATIPATLLSVEDFAAMPRDEAVQYELVEGELVPVASATLRHAWIRDGITSRLRAYLKERPIGIAASEVDCRTTGATVRRPDVLFFSRERALLVDEMRIPIPFAPDIAVEIISPSERTLETHRKIREYLASGSLEVWEIDAEFVQIVIWTPHGVRRVCGEEVLETPLLPGFSMPVSEALAGPPEQV